VTIACGACSGFHGLVCSGTTAKQVASEPDCKPIGFGAMLLEGFVALIALSTIMILSGSQAKGLAPGAIYGQGLGRFLAVLIGEQHLMFATTFGAMAFSTFVFDTLDVSTRLGRYMLQELLGWPGRWGAVGATAVMCLTPLGLLWAADVGSYRLFWTLFGTSNQLLAALSLLVVTVWLRRSGKSYLYTLLPALFVLAVTLTALALQLWAGLTAASGWVARWNGLVSAALIALALALVWMTAQRWRVGKAPSRALL
jgi:carbon starvation protein